MGVGVGTMVGLALSEAELQLEASKEIEGAAEDEGNAEKLALVLLLAVPVAKLEAQEDCEATTVALEETVDHHEALLPPLPLPLLLLPAVAETAQEALIFALPLALELPELLLAKLPVEPLLALATEDTVEQPQKLGTGELVEQPVPEDVGQSLIVPQPLTVEENDALPLFEGVQLCSAVLVPLLDDTALTEAAPLRD